MAAAPGCGTSLHSSPVMLQAEDSAGAAAASIELHPLQVVHHTAALWLQAEDFAGAAALAFELRQPGRLLSVVNKAQEKGPAACQQILAQLVAGFDVDSLRMSLEYAREWNTNARHCHAAQALLQATLLQHPPEVRLGRASCSETGQPRSGAQLPSPASTHWWWAAGRSRDHVSSLVLRMLHVQLCSNAAVVLAPACQAPLGLRWALGACSCCHAGADVTEGAWHVGGLAQPGS